MTRAAYSVVVLRYVHDQVSGEFVNVGLMLYCKDHRFVEFFVLPRAKRIVQFFPGSRAVLIRSALRAATANSKPVKQGLLEARDDVADSVALLSEAASRIVPVDDSALQWSPVTVGLTANPKATFERLWDRLVLRYEEGVAQSKRTDEQVWRTFSKVLEKRNVFARIEEHQVTAKLETVTFKHALKNGKWHLLEPVSFDLANDDSVTDKAKKLLGEMTLLRESDSDFRLYFLVGQPSIPEVKDAYDRALRILEQIPGDKAIYQEFQAEQLATDLTRIAAAG